MRVSPNQIIIGTSIVNMRVFFFFPSEQFEILTIFTIIMLEIFRSNLEKSYKNYKEHFEKILNKLIIIKYKFLKRFQNSILDTYFNKKKLCENFD